MGARASRAAAGLALAGVIGGCSAGGGEGDAFGERLHVAGPPAVEVSGPQGGPFAPQSAQYDIMNRSTDALTWQVTSDAAWLEVSPAGGTLGVGASVTASLALDEVAASQLAIGTHVANLVFSEFGSSTEVSAIVQLVVTGELQVLPAAAFATYCTLAGVLDDDEVTYQLTNLSPSDLDWGAFVTEAWLSVVAPSTGILAPGASTDVVVQLDGIVVSALGEGTWSGVAEFSVNGGSAPPVARDIDVWVTDRPAAHNTGPYDEDLLVPSSSITITADGTVLENVDVAGRILVQANNVTVRNFRVTATPGVTYYPLQVDYGYSGVLFEDGEVIGGISTCVKGPGFTARRLNVHDSGDDGFKVDGNCVIEDSWVHHLGTSPAAHADGVQIRNGSNYVIRGNNFDLFHASSPFAPPGYISNASLSIDQGGGPVDNVLVEGNWLNGGNFTVYLDNVNGTGTATNVRLFDNRFGTGFAFGPLVNDTPDAEISGNVWDETGEEMNINNQ